MVLSEPSSWWKGYEECFQNQSIQWVEVYLSVKPVPVYQTYRRPHSQHRKPWRHRAGVRRAYAVYDQMALVVMILNFKNWVLTKDLRVEHGFKHVFFFEFYIFFSFNNFNWFLKIIFSSFFYIAFLVNGCTFFFWGDGETLNPCFPWNFLKKWLEGNFFRPTKLVALTSSYFSGIFFTLSWTFCVGLFFSGVICRDDVGETRTFTKGFQQYDPISRKGRVVWIIDNWVWFPHDFHIRRLWWCTCWASSSSEGWMAMGSIKTQQWRLSSVLWPWSSGSVLGQERIRISSRWSTTCLAEIALRIRPPVEDGSKEVEDEVHDIFGGNGPSLPRFSNWKKQYLFQSIPEVPNPIRTEVPTFHRSEVKTQLPSFSWVEFHGRSISTSLQDLVAPWIAWPSETLRLLKMRPATAALGATCFTMKGVKVLSAENYGVLMCWFISFPHFIQWKKTWQYS